MQRSEIEAILGRKIRPTSAVEQMTVLEGSTVLVTGAGGSIGSTLCRTLLKDPTITLVALDASEYLLHELIASCSGTAAKRLVPVLGSVTEPSLLRAVLASHAPDTVFHAAAYKHVHLLEANVTEAVRNNVLGTWTVCSEASTVAERLVLISTDKAVEPVGIMGATKLLGEQIVRHFGRVAGRRSFTSVRSGNVFGSSGSVIPLFVRQVTSGGPVTVTDARATRYFVTVEEAVDLALWAVELTRGDDQFVLEAGDPVAITDIVQRLVEVLAPATPPSIEATGLRVGERLHERLFGETEVREATSIPGIWRILRTAPPDFDLPTRVAEITSAVDRRDEVTLRELLSLRGTGGSR